MLALNDCTIADISVHHVGNPTREEALILAREPLDISATGLHDLLHTFFLSPFGNPEYYAFAELIETQEEHAVQRCARQIFEGEQSLHEVSKRLAQLLFERSVHPNVKAGDLFVVRFSDVLVDDELTEAIGIFKSETHHPFLKVDEVSGSFSIRGDFGIAVDKLDKGCLILNTDQAFGYRICMIDKSNKHGEALFWKDDFLKLVPRNDDFHQTKEVIHVTRRFVEKELPEEIDMNKADQIDLLNRTADYFKTRQEYDRSEFEDQVLQTENLISSFRNFNDAYSREREVLAGDRFVISPLAVKQQAKILKSVLKLDKNFHIYIHGNRELIEQGIDPDGRKYYKIYYENES